MCSIKSTLRSSHTPSSGPVQRNSLLAYTVLLIAPAKSAESRFLTSSSSLMSATTTETLPTLFLSEEPPRVINKNVCSFTRLNSYWSSVAVVGHDSLLPISPSTTGGWPQANVSLSGLSALASQTNLSVFVNILGGHILLMTKESRLWTDEGQWGPSTVIQCRCSLGYWC